MFAGRRRLKKKRNPRERKTRVKISNRKVQFPCTHFEEELGLQVLKALPWFPSDEKPGVGVGIANKAEKNPFLTSSPHPYRTNHSVLLASECFYCSICKPFFPLNLLGDIGH